MREGGGGNEIERIGETSRHLTNFRYIAKISLARCRAHFRPDGRDILGPLGQCRGPTACGETGVRGRSPGCGMRIGMHSCAARAGVIILIIRDFGSSTSQKDSRGKDADRPSGIALGDVGSTRAA